MRRERPATSSSSKAPAAPDLFQILLPKAHAHIPKGAAAMWERHYQHQQNQHQSTSSPSKPATPTRPQTSGRVSTRSAAPQSPRYALTSPPPQSEPLSPRCRSADPLALSPRARLKATEVRSPSQLDHKDTEATSPTASQLQPQPQLVLNTQSREHVETKACMLAYMHRIDVDKLQHLREEAASTIETIKAKQILARGGLLDDGSLLETTKRKTSFLLRHFFTLGESNNATSLAKQDFVLHDVIDEWACSDHASADEIAAVWKSMLAHIEHSYVLRRQLVAKAEPDPLSVAIAMDCLRKLPAKLPEYRRMLDVIITLVGTGLFMAEEDNIEEPREMREEEDESTVPWNGATTTRRRQRRCYFEECQRLLDDAKQQKEEMRRARLALEAQNGTTQSRTPIQQLQTLLDSVDEQITAESISFGQKEALFVAFLRSNLDKLHQAALSESLHFIFTTETTDGKTKQFFYDTWMPLLNAEDVTRILTELTQQQLPAFQQFCKDNFDAIDKLLMGDGVASTSSSNNSNSSTDSRRHSASAPAITPTTTLFQDLIERHPAQFASVLWASPYLTAHVFQDSNHLIVRVLEQNIVLISQVLQQRQDVLLALFNHTLRDNASAMEEFLLNHPKALSDLLLNRPAAVAAAIKSHPSILADILQASRATLARVLGTMPELLCHLFKTTPELLAQTIREDLTILPLAFSLVPQSLSDALERHPEFFVDVAHRKPTLVSKLFAKYPDLLLDPLEANPSVFSNFLVHHKKILPDFSDPSFDPEFFQFERKRFVENGQQTEKRFCKYDGKLRLREKIKFQEDELLSSIHRLSNSSSGSSSVTSTISTTTTTTTTSAAVGGRTTPALGGDNKQVKDAKVAVTLAPNQVVSEIARLYVKKMEANALGDAAGKKRRPLVDFVRDLYLQELGFQSKAQKKLALLLTGAKQCDKESGRIKWFVKFMNASQGSSRNELSKEIVWSYHPLASEFYLAAMQFLVALPVAGDQQQQLVQRLDEELVRPCLVGYTRVKQFIEDPLVTQMLPAKEQRQQLLTTITEKEHAIHGSSSSSASSSSSSSDPTTTTAAHSGHRSSSSVTVSMLHLEDVLESLMLVWIHHHDTIRGDWTMQFQLVNPDGSGVIRFNVFADLVRAKVPTLDTRGIMKIYHQCGEENDLGEFFLVVDDFTLAMSILHEQDALRQYAARTALASTTST